MKKISDQIIIGAFAFCLFFIANSCIKDKSLLGNKNVNIPTLSYGGDSSFVVYIYDTLKITPVIIETVPGAGKYKYQWTIFWDNEYDATYDDIDTIANTKNLNWEVTTYPDDYIVSLKITDTTTGIIAIKNYKVKILSFYGEGWLIMNNKPNYAYVSFLSTDDRRMDDCIQKSDPTAKLIGKGLGVYAGVISYMEQVITFTDQNPVFYYGDNFELHYGPQRLFTFNFQPSKPYFQLTSNNYDMYIINNGLVYGAETPYTDDVYVPFSTQFYCETNYKLFPYIMFGSRFPSIFYDNLNKRFWLQAANNGRTLASFGTYAGSSFDPNNVGLTMVGADRGPSNEFFGVMKDDATSDFYIYTMLPSNRSTPIGAKQKILNSPDLINAKKFTMSESAKQLFYATDNALYMYDYASNKSQQIYAFDASTKIKDLKMYKSIGWGRFTNSSYNKRLVVATYNGTQGQIYYFELGTNGLIPTNTYSKKFDGFGDIENISYRVPAY